VMPTEFNICQYPSSDRTSAATAVDGDQPEHRFAVKALIDHFLSAADADDPCSWDHVGGDSVRRGNYGPREIKMRGEAVEMGLHRGGVQIA
jgi:hypothetical protein